MTPTIIVGDGIEATQEDLHLFGSLEAFAERVANGEGTAATKVGSVVEDRWIMEDRYLQLSQKGTGTFDSDSARIALFDADHTPIVEVRVEGIVTLQRSSTEQQLRSRTLLIARIAMEVIRSSIDGRHLSTEDALAAGRAACHRTRDHLDSDQEQSAAYSRQKDGGIFAAFVPGTSWRPMRLSVGGRQMPIELRPAVPHMVSGTLTGRPRDPRHPALSVYPWDMAMDLAKSDTVARMRDEIVLTRVCAMTGDPR